MASKHRNTCSINSPGFRQTGLYKTWRNCESSSTNRNSLLMRGRMGFGWNLVMAQDGPEFKDRRLKEKRNESYYNILEKNQLFFNFHPNKANSSRSGLNWTTTDEDGIERREDAHNVVLTRSTILYRMKVNWPHSIASTYWLRSRVSPFLASAPCKPG